ncbi:RNA pseudouridylate synthase domain-containing protein 1 [Labeo rohita]|uniref:RNA pseudouridylate synthase domain-containing protein 1 n=1 Tax=Labeo rohita TaxID=84645 RepID=A0ABQ8MTP2_LABRO|nr:RNA pseudouridylate synthase domain-containing protein 1 [Labeo rohita]
MEPASLENLCVLYHSANYIVVNKHWDIRIDSKMWYEKQTVQSQLKHRFPELADPGTYYGFRFCHQLDFSTSGALCVALNKAAAGQAYRCFKDRLVTKAYLALPCQTELTVLEYGEYDGDPVTKVLLQPLTGRTHQLRVHCSAIGHPIVGDYTYSLRTDDAPYRMMLHAYFLHIPLEHEPIHVTAPDPFVPTLDSKWEPRRCVNVLEDLLKNILTKPQMEIQEEPEPVNKKSSPVESEEQQAQCQQWLCEWNLD